MSVLLGFSGTLVDPNMRAPLQAAEIVDPEAVGEPQHILAAVARIGGLPRSDSRPVPESERLAHALSGTESATVFSRIAIPDPVTLPSLRIEPAVVIDLK